MTGHVVLDTIWLVVAVLLFVVVFPLVMRHNVIPFEFDLSKREDKVFLAWTIAAAMFICTVWPLVVAIGILVAPMYFFLVKRASNG